MKKPKTTKLLLSLLKLLIAITVFSINTTFAQADIDEDLTPEVGVGTFYFTEETNDQDFKKIDELKEKIRILNTKTSGVMVYKSSDATNYNLCVSEHQKREAKNANYIISAIPDIPKASSTSKTTTTSTTTKSTTQQSSSSYYDSEKCFFAGSSDNFKFAENAYTKLQCSLSDIQKVLTESDKQSFISAYQSHSNEVFNQSCPKAFQEEITINTSVKAEEKKKAEKSLGTNIDQCKILLRNRICAAAVTQKYIEERKKIQEELKRLENPELYKCEYKDGKINNLVCVQLTEKLGTTKVIGADSGLGLIKAYLALIYRFGVIMIGVVAFLIIVVQGLKISVGGSEQIEDAKKKLTDAIVGLALLLLAGTILYIINPNFFTIA